MGAKDRWSHLTQEIKTTLKHEFGWVNISRVDPLGGSFCEAAGEELAFDDWEAPSVNELFEFSAPPLYLVRLDMSPRIETVLLTGEIVSYPGFWEETSLSINHLPLEVLRPVESVPVIQLDTRSYGVDCLGEMEVFSADLPIELSDKIQCEPPLNKVRVYYAERLIRRIPIKRRPLSWDSFAQEEIYLFWSKLMTQHRVSLGEAELWGVFPLVPLNLLAKIWLDADRTLNMFLHQQALKPKIVYLITGRIKKNSRLIQTAVTPAELAKTRLS